MIIYSCNRELRDYEYGVYFDGAGFNIYSLPFYCRFRIKDVPVRFDDRKIIGIKNKTGDFQSYLKRVVKFAAFESITAIAVPCSNTLTLQEVSSLSALLGDLAEEVSVRIILDQSFLKRINAKNVSIISNYVVRNYVQGSKPQFSYHTPELQDLINKIKDRPELQFSIGEKDEDRLEQNKREREERYRKANDYSDHVKMSLEELKQEFEEKEPELEKSFSDTLFDLIDEHHADEVQLYKKANLDRRLFSKIRSNPDYHPNKSTVLSLCMALNLDIEETEILLNTIGASLSMSDLSDVIVKSFILNGIYDLNQLNLILLEKNLRPLTYY